MPALSLTLPKSVQRKINDLTLSRRKTEFLVKLINEYDGTDLEEDSTSKSVFDVDDDTIARLDAIQAQNGIRSRNLTMILLIELAHQRYEAKQRARLSPPNKSDNI